MNSGTSILICSVRFHIGIRWEMLTTVEYRKNFESDFMKKINYPYIKVPLMLARKRTIAGWTNSISNFSYWSFK